MNLWHVLLTLAGVLVALSLVGGVRHHRRQSTQREPIGLLDSARQLPATVRFLRQLASDPTLPAGVRLRLGLVLVYLVLPVDRVRQVVRVGPSERRRASTRR
jgi:hypothetical protein